MFTAEVHLNLSAQKNSGESVKVYETKYPFTKQYCRSKIEEWNIVVFID